MDYKNIVFDESKEMEMFFDVAGSVQILKINTINSNYFLQEGKKFDEEAAKRVDANGICKVIYLADKVPPLSAVLTFLENPNFQVTFGIYAVITPKDMSLLDKFIPIVTYGIDITGLRDKYALKVFDYTHREDMSAVFKWIEETEQKRLKGEEITPQSL